MDGSVMRVSASVSLWSVGELEAQRMGTSTGKEGTSGGTH